ncbi:gastrula zinc finger protein xFG20-1-like [Clupea harengus]|uniref:Gastrula zinc finger protein xFG20-1-like n=1 Tax=Clupea harengus TaxID=7950 RepID=A0A6P3W398_CLUHA|nr:gastrula zinc finger protein xFG20-1-like [Clupea harengus]
MIHKCAVAGCPNKSDTIIHYTLPEELNRRRQWTQFVERGGKEENVSVSSRICGSHFAEDNFTKLDLGFTTRLILNVNAIPTIYPEELVEQQNKSDHLPLRESYINGTENISLQFLKEEPFEDDMTGEPVEDYMTGEPVEDEMSDESFNVVKVEPHDENGYVDSSFEQTSEDSMLSGDPGITTEPFQQHDDRKPFHCVYCGEGFLNKGVLKQHELKHKTVKVNPFLKEYHCHQCGRDFSHKAFLKAHQKVHASVESQMSFSCTKCDRRFRKKSSLNKHMHNHLARTNYPCPVCGEEFEIKGSLHTHIRSHPGERFPCKYCNQRFLKIDAYLKHVDRHTVVTPYYCEKCKVYQLTQRGFLLHQKRHARTDLEMHLAKTGPVVVKKGRPLKYPAKMKNLPQQGEAKPQVDSEVPEPNLTLQSLCDTPLEASGEDPLHETTGPSDEAEMEEEEEEEETSPEIEIEEASDDNLEESTNDQEIGGPDLPLDLLTVP